jgi:hypothetical protein
MGKFIGWLEVKRDTSFRELGQSAQRWTDMVAVGGRAPVYESSIRGMVVAHIPCKITNQVSDDLIMGQLHSHPEKDAAAVGKMTTYYYSVYDYSMFHNTDYTPVPDWALTNFFHCSKCSYSHEYKDGILPETDNCPKCHAVGFRRQVMENGVLLVDFDPSVHLK